MKTLSGRFYNNAVCRWVTLPPTLPGTDQLTPIELGQLILAFPFILRSALRLHHKLCGNPSNRCDTRVIPTVPGRHKGERVAGLIWRNGGRDHGNEPGNMQEITPSEER